MSTVDVNNNDSGLEEVVEGLLGDRNHFVLDPDDHAFYVNDGDELVPVHLTPIEFRIAWYLMLTPNKERSHIEILTTVWGPEYEQESLVKYHVNRLRDKLREHHLESHLVTVKGVGYRMG